MVFDDSTRRILRDQGLILLLPAAMALASVPVALLTGDDFAAAPLLWTGGVCSALGAGIARACGKCEALNLRHAMISVVLAWFTVPVVGAVVIYAVAHAVPPDGPIQGVAVFASPLNTLFESMSGFTSTGLTMVERPDALPPILQWWRSFSQWIGGVGVIVLMLAVFQPDDDGERLYLSEARKRRIGDTLNRTARNIWWIYLFYSLLGLCLLRATGLDWWQSVNFGMTGIATGGFSITNDSMAGFGPGPKIAMTGLMLLGAISFATHFKLLTKRDPSDFRTDPQYPLFAGLLIGGVVLMLAENRWYGVPGDWLDAVFQWVSALTTSGFSTQSLAEWSPTAQVLLALAMSTGAIAGATTGGLKLRRVVILSGAVRQRLRAVLRNPSRLSDTEPLVPDMPEPRARRVEAAEFMLSLWVLAVVAGALLLIHAAGPETAFSAALLEIASALGNAGLSAGITGPDLHWTGRAGLVVIMWMGRLEILPILILIAHVLSYRKRLMPGD